MPGEIVDMPRAERSHEIGEVFRRRVEAIVQQLRYDILASKHPIKCRCEYHNTSEHVIDTLATHSHAAESRKKAILIESKRTMPSLRDISNMVIDLANKADCLGKYSHYAGVNEALVLTESDVSLNAKGEFNKASTKIASSRETHISLVSGSRFRLMEAMSRLVKQYVSNSSITIVPAGKNLWQDIGSPCPFNIDLIPKYYVCSLRPPEFRVSVFKMNMGSYNSKDLVEEMAWIKEYEGVLEQIHTFEGFTNTVSVDVKAAGLEIGLVDHNLRKTFFVNYLNYNRVDS